MKFAARALTPAGGSHVSLLPRVLMSLLALAFVAAGVGVFVYHVSILRTWQPAEATIVRSDVIEFRNRKGRGMFRGEVELAYTVAGRQYRTPDAFRYASSSESAIREPIETTYAPGTSHRIFYDPANPHAVRWDVGLNLTFFLLPLIFTGVGLILIGACAWLWRLPFPARMACTRCGALGAPHEQFCPRCGQRLMPDDRRPDDPQAPDDAQLKLPPQPPRENPRALLLVGTFFGIPGFACLLGAAWLGWTTYVSTQLWPTAEATVVSAAIETHRSSDGTPSYQLAVEFHHGDGPQPARAAGQSLYASRSFAWIAQRIERFPVGSTHTVRVNPRDPADVRFDLESPVLNWMPTAGLGLFGGIFAAIGLGLVARARRTRCKNCTHSLRRGASYCGACGTVLG